MALHHAQTVLGEEELHYASITPGEWPEPPKGVTNVTSRWHGDSGTTRPTWLT